MAGLLSKDEMQLLADDVRENRRIVTLDLDGNELSGPLPVDLWKLAGMTLMHLSENQFSGPLPTELRVRVRALSIICALSIIIENLTLTIKFTLSFRSQKNLLLPNTRQSTPF